MECYHCKKKIKNSEGLCEICYTNDSLIITYFEALRLYKLHPNDMSRAKIFHTKEECKWEYVYLRGEFHEFMRGFVKDLPASNIKKRNFYKLDNVQKKKEEEFMTIYKNQDITRNILDDLLEKEGVEDVIDVIILKERLLREYITKDIVGLEPALFIFKQVTDMYHKIRDRVEREKVINALINKLIDPDFYDEAKHHSSYSQYIAGTGTLEENFTQIESHVESIKEREIRRNKMDEIIKACMSEEYWEIARSVQGYYQYIYCNRGTLDENFAGIQKRVEEVMEKEDREKIIRMELMENYHNFEKLLKLRVVQTYIDKGNMDVSQVLKHVKYLC